MPRPRPSGPSLEWYRGTWYIRWRDAGRLKRTATGTSNDTRARQTLADFEASLERHPLKLNVSEALTRYAAARLGKVVAHARLESAADALRDALGTLRVDQVTQARWDVYASRRSVKGREGLVARLVSPGTLRREYNVLRAALRLAWKDGFLTKPPSLEPPADSAPRDRYLTKDEARSLIAAAHTPHVRLFVALAIYTGARKGSILALTWDRVNFQAGMIDFQEAGRQLTSKRRAIVPITDGLRLLLTEAHTMRQSDYVVEFNGRAVPTGLRWSFNRLCERAGMTWRPTPHHLKHSVASWMAMEGVPIDQAADWLATDPKTLRRTYRKFDPAYLRPVAAALNL